MYPSVQFWDLLFLAYISDLPPTSDCLLTTASSTCKSAAATGPTALGGLGEHLANELQPQQVQHIPNLTKQTKEFTPDDLLSPWTTASGGEFQQIPRGNNHSPIRVWVVYTGPAIECVRIWLMSR